MTPVQQPPQPKDTFGLGPFSSWANLGAVVVMFYMFYQAQSNAFEIYRQDKILGREDLKLQWGAIKDMQTSQSSDMRTVVEALKKLQESQVEIQRVNREMLDELKAIKGKQ